MKRETVDTIFETHVHNGANIPCWMLSQYQNFRYHFINKTDWDVELDHDWKMDRDEFDDREETRHLIVTAYNKQTQVVRVIGGVRLINTVHSYQLLNDSYDAMKMGLNLPRDPSVIEGSRWVTKVDGSEAADVAISLLMQLMFCCAQEQGAHTLIAAVPIKWERWLNSYKIETLGHRDTDVYREHVEKYLIIQFPLNQVFAQAGEEQRLMREEIPVVA